MVDLQHLTNGLKAFDVHVYYTPEAREKAQALREKIRHELSGEIFKLSPMYDKLMGPHPLPMFDFQILPAFLGPMILWLIRHRGDLTVLVHQVSGDDPLDHSAGALWMGEKLELDVTKLDPSPAKT